MNKLILDRINFKLPESSQRKQTPEGYLVTAGKVARIGIQDYLGYEIGIEGADQSSVIKVLRSEKEVFNKESLKSFKDKDVTLEHPFDLVDSSNYKLNSVGHVTSAGRRDGDYIVIDMVIKDADAIAAIEDGKVQLSAGYSANFKPKEGVFDGQEYSFEQTDIYINHVALVDSARAGSEAKIFDSNKKEFVMFKINFNDKSVSVEDENVATLIQSSVDSLSEELKMSKASLTDSMAKMSSMEGERDSAQAELKALKDSASDESLSARIASIMQTKETALKLIGDKFTCDSLNEMDMIRHTLSVSHPKTNFSGKPDAYLQAYFDADAEKKAEDEDEEEDDEKKAKDSMSNLSSDMSKDSKVTDLRAQKDEAMRSAWKKTIGLGE